MAGKMMWNETVNPNWVRASCNALSPNIAAPPFCLAGGNQRQRRCSKLTLQGFATVSPLRASIPVVAGCILGGGFARIVRPLYSFCGRRAFRRRILRSPDTLAGGSHRLVMSFGLL